MPDDITNGLELVIDRIDEHGAVSIEGRWFPEAHAQALLDVAEAAAAFVAGWPYVIAHGPLNLAAALDRLDEARR